MNNIESRGLDKEKVSPTPLDRKTALELAAKWHRLKGDEDAKVLVSTASIFLAFFFSESVTVKSHQITALECAVMLTLQCPDEVVAQAEVMAAFIGDGEVAHAHL